MLCIYQLFNLIMDNTPSTHFIFWEDLQWNNIAIISPNLQKVFKFLVEANEELDSFLNIGTPILNMKQNIIIPMLEKYAKVIKLLEINNISHQFNVSKEDIEDFVNFQIHLGIRVKMIALFAFMETVFCLITIYNSKLSDEWEIIKKSNNDLPKWIGKYILTERNYFYKQNISRFKKITTRNLILLRNSLTHFFSIGKNIMLFEWDEEMRKKFDKLNDVALLSPIEFNSLLWWMISLLFQEWTNDFSKNKTDFEERISFVIKIIEERAPVLLSWQWEPFKF